MTDATSDDTADDTADATANADADARAADVPLDGSGAIAPDEVLAGAPGGQDDAENRTESVNEPAKVLRIGSMVKTLLDEVRAAPLDEKSRVRLREIYEQSIRDLTEGLSRTWWPSSSGWRRPSTSKRRARPSCASPRPSWSGGSRGCSTGSRRR